MFLEKRKSTTQSFSHKSEITNSDSNIELDVILPNNDNYLQPLFAANSATKKIIASPKISFVQNNVRNKKAALKSETTHPKYETKNIYYKESRNRKDFIQWGLISLVSSLGITSIFLSRRKKIKQVSKWASKNKIKTKLAIAGAAILNSASSLIFGELLYRNQVHIPDNLTEFSIGAFGITLLLYPKKQNIVFDKIAYLKRKLADFSLAIFSSMMIISGSYHQEPNLNFKTIIMPSALESKSITKKGSQLEKQQDKSNVTSTYFQEEKQKESMKWWQGLIIFFIILTSILTTLAIMVLSCVIACSGSEGLAYLVLFGGTILTIFLCAYGIRQITKIKITPKPENKPI